MTADALAPLAAAPSESPSRVASRALPRSVLVVIAVASGLAVASVYYAHPVLDAIAASFGMSASTVGIVVTIIETFIGIFVGAVAGWRRGWVDSVLMRFVDVLLGIPYLVLALAMVTVLGRGVTAGFRAADDNVAGLGSLHVDGGIA